jgi:NAD(P)-dependent dehydrogenase (short-subunit alcohol dehydrogenase family)
VTGSESGIGRAASVALARDGCDVVLGWLSDRAAVQESAAGVEGHGRRALAQRLDVSEPGAAAAAVAAALDHFGRLDVLVQCAAIARMNPALDVPEAVVREVLEVDLIGPFLLAQAAAAEMVRAGRGGRIVNVTSIHDERPLGGQVAYTMAKHGLAGMTKVLALELAAHGITVNAVAPGATATAMTGAAGLDVRSSPRPGIPLGRLADPREVADAIAHHCAPTSGYVTGARILIDGGLDLPIPDAAPAPPRDTRWTRLRRRAKA